VLPHRSEAAPQPPQPQESPQRPLPPDMQRQPLATAELVQRPDSRSSHRSGLQLGSVLPGAVTGAAAATGGAAAAATATGVVASAAPAAGHSAIAAGTVELVQHPGGGSSRRSGLQVGSASPGAAAAAAASTVAAAAAHSCLFFHFVLQSDLTLSSFLFSVPPPSRIADVSQSTHHASRSSQQSLFLILPQELPPGNTFTYLSNNLDYPKRSTL
jgi:hypothetical protein